MNHENLNKLIANYIENFQVFNNEEHREFYKWQAVKHFKDKFDIDAPNFSAMFKESVRLTENLINNHIVQPTNGIIKLAERPELTETIRQMFKDLFSEDNGNIHLRQEKIKHFILQCDKLLNTYEPGKWKYAQDTRTVIFYLSLMYPEQNYMFKSTQANKFKYCVEFEDDFGAGETFSLKTYYQLCDELVRAIKANDKLIQLHQSRLTDDMLVDDDFHILAYDILYCGVSYNLYNNISIVNHRKNRKNVNQEKRELQERRNSIIQELEVLIPELETIVKQRAEYDYFSTKGLQVRHKTFGEGFVSQHNTHNIIVAFKETEKKFSMPQGFTNGFLSTDSSEVISILLQIAEIDQRIKEYEEKIRALEFKLSLLND